eukprot:10778731-Ditylum_brightwellii.AAC.1
MIDGDASQIVWMTSRDAPSMAAMGEVGFSEYGITINFPPILLVVCVMVKQCVESFTGHCAFEMQTAEYGGCDSENVSTACPEKS